MITLGSRHGMGGQTEGVVCDSRVRPRETWTERKESKIRCRSVSLLIYLQTTYLFRPMERGSLKVRTLVVFASVQFPERRFQSVRVDRSHVLYLRPVTYLSGTKRSFSRGGREPGVRRVCLTGPVVVWTDRRTGPQTYSCRRGIELIL